MRLPASVALVLILVGAASAAAPAPSKAAGRCGGSPSSVADEPRWAAPRRMTVLVDSVLLSGLPALRRELPCWHIAKLGRPAWMLRAAEREVRTRRRRVARLVVIGLGYNSLWERRRRRFGYWSRRFDREAHRLIETLQRRGAEQVVWVTLRESNASNVPPHARGELDNYAWYFGYVNERLRLLDAGREDVVLADWATAGASPGLTYDSIHLNARGGRRMAKTIEGAIRARIAESHAAASTATAPATGTSSEGDRFTLSGRIATVVLTRPLAPGRTLELECGRYSTAGDAVGRGRAKGRGLRTVRVRLRRAVAGAEWCEFTGPRLRRAAAALQPGAPTVEPVTPGQGVREAEAEDRNGGGRFLVRGSLVTVQMNRPFRRSVVAGIACGVHDGPIGYRRTAVAAGQRTITVDTERDLAGAAWCVLEAPGGADVFAATLP